MAIARGAIIALLALTGLLGLSAFLYLSRETASPTAKIKSIAVLPLKPLTAEENNKVLGLGLADALITKLGSLKQIVVRPTSAVALFADAPADSIEIGRKLGVDAVLEGTIQESATTRGFRLSCGKRVIKMMAAIRQDSVSLDQ